MREERPHLRPAPALEHKAFRVPVVVGPEGLVIISGCAYSMPRAAAGLLGVALLEPDAVHVTTGRFHASHPRLRGSHAVSILPEHESGTAWV